MDFSRVTNAELPDIANKVMHISDGNKIIWRYSRIPKEYQEVEWIKNSIGAYIDTGIIPQYGDEFRIKFVPNNTYSGAIPGVFMSENKMGINCYADYLQFYYGGTQRKFYVYLYYKTGGRTYPAVGDAWDRDDIAPHIIDTSKKKYTKGQDIPNSSYYLFASNGGSGNFNKLFKIWYAEIPNRLNLVPCYRKSDGVIGMYDLYGNICPLTNTPFFINAGTGNFEKGPDILY